MALTGTEKQRREKREKCEKIAQKQKSNVRLPFISSLSLVSWLSKYAGILRQLALSTVLSREESQVFLLRSNLMRKLTCMKA